MRRALIGGCLFVALCVASSFGQQPDDFGKRGGKAGKGKGFKAFEGAPKMDAPGPHRWEYAIRRREDFQEMGGDDLQRAMNRMGESGWELVAVDGTFAQGRGHAYFKRPRNGPMPPAEADVMRDQPVPPAPPTPPGCPGGFGGFGGFARGPGNNVPQPKETTTIITLKNAQPSSMTQMLTMVFGTTGARFVPDSRTGRLILIAPEDKLAEIRKMVEELDQPAPTDRRMTK